MKQVYIVTHISGGGWDQDVCGVYRSYTKAVVDCIRVLGDRFTVIEPARSGGTYVWAGDNLKYVVRANAMNELY
jgi:hypothetical protein